MSWSISASGDRNSVLERLAEQSNNITHLVGTEAELKDKAVALAVAVVEACEDGSVTSVSLYGSASIGRHGDQRKQSVTVSVSTQP